MAAPNPKAKSKATAIPPKAPGAVAGGSARSSAAAAKGRAPATASSSGSLGRARAGSRGAASATRSGSQPRPQQAQSAAPREWPPKVPLGPIADVLPMIIKDDEDIDCLLLQRQQAAPDEASASDSASSMQSLGLGVTPEAMEYICDCLQRNTTVTHLNASFNRLGPAGAAPLARLLTSRVASGELPLAKLSLNYCSLGDEGARLLAEAVTPIKGIRVIELMGNEIAGKGAATLLDMLKSNRTISQLALGFNDVPEEIASQIDKVLMMR